MRTGASSSSAQTKRRRRRQIAAAPATNGARIRGSTAASQIYRVLRTEILSMARKPGEPINDREIEAALGVSRTPIREAILRLAAENLIEILPQSGTFVARIPLAVLPEAIVIRRTLEELTVRAAAERATEEQIAQLWSNLAWQRECAGAKDTLEFYAADEEFHSTIATIAGYSSVWPLVLQVKVQVDRCCHLTLPQSGRMNRLLKEHRAIAQGIRDHDAGQAVAALDVHLNGILSEVAAAPNFDSNYFITEPAQGGRPAK